MPGSTKIDGTELVAGYNDGRISITCRGGDPDAFDWSASWTDSVEVMAVIVKGGDLANIYYYDGSVRSDSGPHAAAQRRRAEPADQPRRVLLRPEGRADADAERAEGRGRHVEDPAHLGDRQAGQGGGCVRCDVRRQRLARPCGRRGRLVHLEGDGHALAGADVRRDGHDQARQQRIRRRHRRQRLRLAAGCGDRLRQRAEHRCHGARQHHRELRLQRHAWHTGGEQHRHGDLGLGRLRPGNGDDRMGGSDRGRDPRVRRGRRSDRPVPRARRSHERLVDEDVRRAVDVPERHPVAESRVARTRPP